MIRFWIALFAAAALLQGGCASVSVERGKDLSSAGVAYAQATAAVIDMAVDAAIDASSERQIRKRMGPAATLQERAEREATLKELDQALVENVQNYVRLKRSVGAVQAYFTGLQALAGATPAQATENAVQGLVGHVNGLNLALQGGKEISSEKGSAIAAVAGMFIKQAHGAAVARALERDATVITRALVLQELALRLAVGDVVASMNDANARFERDRVIKPYLAGGVGQDWADDRRIAVKTRAIGTSPQAVASAAEAARQMQAVWGRILSGETSGAEFSLLLRDVQELLDAANALKKTNPGH